MSIHKDEKIKTWYFTVKIDDKQIKRRGFETKSKAKDAERKLLNEYENKDNECCI